MTRWLEIAGCNGGDDPFGRFEGAPTILTSHLRLLAVVNRVAKVALFFQDRVVIRNRQVFLAQVELEKLFFELHTFRG